MSTAQVITWKGLQSKTMKMGKKLLPVYLVLILTLSISGCGKQPVSESPVGKTESAGVSASEGSGDEKEETNTSASKQTEAVASNEKVVSATTTPEFSTVDENEITQEDIQTDTQEETEAMLQMMIGDTLVAVEWEENESVQALRDLCMGTPLTIQMSMYGGFEQVGSIGQSLPRNDVQTTTGAGDVVLYSGNQIVVFYGSNSWAYTRLGHITDQNAAGMSELLGNGDVTITISME